jgi:molybdenum cofactor guanylyltransferase
MTDRERQTANLDRIWLSAIILAGGRSSRMGRDKASIEIDGIPLIRRIYNVVALCQVDPLLTPAQPLLSQRIHIVTPWAERYRSMLPTECQFIAEREPDRGPLMGFAQGLTAIRSTWILLLACDLPNLSTPTIQTWIDRLPSIPAESIACLPKYLDRGWEPLCGFYRHTCLDSLLAYIEGGGRSFQGWLEQNHVTELPIVDRQCLLNCNTPIDLATVSQHHSIDIN